MGQEYLFLIMNELLHFEKLLIFSEKKTFALLFHFLFVDLGFSSLLLKYLCTLSVEAFVLELWPKFILLKKLIFPHSQFFFHLQSFYV